MHPSTGLRGLTPILALIAIAWDGLFGGKVCTLIGDGILESRDVRPRYYKRKPNGDGCDPTCRVATITILLES
jgi:hypothetical protein